MDRVFVKDCTDVEQFIRRYNKRLRRDLNCWGEDFIHEKIANYNEQIKRFGFATITHHSSVTGETVYFKPDNTAPK